MESARDLFEHELSSALDAASRARTTLPSIVKKTTEEKLTKVLDEFVSAVDEHVGRLEKISKLVGAGSGEPNRPVRGMLDELKSGVGQARSPEVVDLYAGEGVADVAQYLESGYQLLLQLAERSGLTHSSPEIGELLEPCFKEAKRSVRRLQKQLEKAVEKVRPN